MAILLGNLKLKELEENHGFSLSDEHRQTLESMRQNTAQPIQKDKFHIFDMPRTILCGSEAIAVKVYEILKQYEIKGNIDIAIEQT